MMDAICATLRQFEAEECCGFLPNFALVADVLEAAKKMDSKKMCGIFATTESGQRCEVCQRLHDTIQRLEDSLR